MSSDLSSALSVRLSTPDGRAELEAAIRSLDQLGETDPVRRAAKARQLLDPGLATIALAQADLRSRASDKFGDLAARLFFTPDGFEQSSRREVADHRAVRYARAGLHEVLDLCCGIGADAAAFVRAGLAVTAVDADPATAAIAAANLPGASVLNQLAQDTAWRDANSVFLDPARRTARGRTFDPASFSPPFEFVAQVLAEHRFAAAKLGPGLPHDLVPAGVEAEWVSWQGGVKEAVLWSSGFATCARRATILPEGSELTDADESTDDTRDIGAFVYEPDGAVIRAGLVQQAAALLPGGARIDEHLAYLTADALVATPFATAFEVIEVLPYSVKSLRSELRRREVGIVEIKKRGVDIDPAALRKELKPSGPNSLTVLLARVGNDRLAILANRPTATSGPA